MFEDEFAAFKKAAAEKKARLEAKAQQEQAAFFKFREAFEDACINVIGPLFQATVATARANGFDAGMREGSVDKATRAISLEISKKPMTPPFLTCTYTVEAHQGSTRDVTLKTSYGPGKTEERQVDLLTLDKNQLVEHVRLFVRMALPTLEG